VTLPLEAAAVEAARACLGNAVYQTPCPSSPTLPELLVRLGVVRQDRPGALARLTGPIAEERVNILQIEHDRAFSRQAIGGTEVELTLETSGAHADRAPQAAACGCRIRGRRTGRCEPGHGRRGGARGR
jgi:hypothetical protein